MTISPETIHRLRLRAGARCECTMTECSHHVGRCNELFEGDWHAHKKTPSGSDNLKNLTAMCQTCYQNIVQMADSNQNELVRVP